MKIFKSLALVLATVFSFNAGAYTINGDLNLLGNEYIASGKSLGINTSSPAAKLHIVASADSEQVTRITASGTATGLTTQIYNSDASKRFLNRYDFGTDLYTFQTDSGVLFAMKRGGNVSIGSGRQFQLDSTSVAGTSYLISDALNTISTYTGSSQRFYVNNTSVGLNGTNLLVDSTKFIYFDGGTDTSIDEVSSNNLRFKVGGAEALRMQNSSSALTQFGINNGGTNPSTLYGGADLIVGNSTDAQSRAIVIQSGSNQNGYLLFSDTHGSSEGLIYYDHSADTLTFSAATGSMVMRTNGELLLPAVNPPTANYANRNGIAKAWLRATSSGTITASYNISSVTRSGAGSYDVFFNTDFSSTSSYACIVTALNLANYIGLTYGTGDMVVEVNDAATGTNVDANFDLVCYGTQ